MKEYLLLLPIIFIFHDMEEVVGFGWFFRRNPDLFKRFPRITKAYIGFTDMGFAAAVFQIGAQHLALDVEKAALPPQLLGEEALAEVLLEDLLSGGVFGTATRSRHHSAAITHNAVSADRTGEKPSLRQNLFPPRQALEGRYPYLKKAPWLLPAAWATRLARYSTEVLRRSDSDAAETLQIARERMELLRKLDIMD